MLDSTDFWWTNRRTSQRRREFAVLLAYGYLANGQRRLLGAHAAPTARTGDYLDLLAGLELPEPPASVVADDDRAIQAAVRVMWGSGATTPYLFTCEYHLRQRAQDALQADKADAPRGRWMRRLDTAFRRPEGWEEFRDSCATLGTAARWVTANDQLISAQVVARHQLPAHYSTAAAEAAAAKLRGLFEQRSFALRNARRTNLLLGLACLHLNNQDDAATYHRILREHTEALGGYPATRQRTNRDKGRDPATGKRMSSLR